MPETLAWISLMPVKAVEVPGSTVGDAGGAGPGGGGGAVSAGGGLVEAPDCGT